MARETKYGLSLIAVLCMGLVAAIGWRFSRETRSQHAIDLRRAEPASHSAKPTEPPKLVLRAADGDQATGEAAPPTPAIASSDSWARAQLASAAEPAPLPPRQRYPLMPAPRSADPQPSLSPEENPPIHQPASMPHTSYRPEDSPASASPEPTSNVASPDDTSRMPGRRRMASSGSNSTEVPASTAVTAREAITIAAEQPAEGSRYAQPAFTPSSGAATPLEATQAEPIAEPRTYRRPEFGASAQRFTPPVNRMAIAPDERGDGTAVVRPNDTFWTISERAYGTGAYFKALIRYNADKHPLPDRLALGDTVLVPPMSELVQKFPRECPKPRHGGEGGIRNAAAPMSVAGGRRYEVREGDTLFDIARFELGDGARWVEIYQMNRDQLTDDFHYVKPGSILMLPGRTPEADRVAKEPADTRLR